MKKGRTPGEKEEDGQQLWQAVTRGIKSYSPGKKQSAEPPPARRRKNVPQEAVPAPAPLKPGKGFDRSTETKLKRGKLPLEGRLDLHGMTQAEAHAALHRFLLAAVAAEKRTVLVITGKGLKSEGVLKRMLPLWLEDRALEKYIVAVTPAAPKDGGSGAFYLRLRKKG